MIRRLALKDWRNYEDLDVKLDPGTTFVVAPNGVGKTSLIEAAAWALYGDAGVRPDGAVRAGATSASATVELELPDGRILSTTRRFPKKVGRALPAPTVRLDRRDIDPKTAPAILQSAYAADPIFLARLTMPRGPVDVDSPSDLGLQEHLGRFFGVDGLQRAVEQLDGLIRENAKNIRATKKAAPVNARRLATLRSRVGAANEVAAHAGRAHAEARKSWEQAQTDERRQAAYALWRANHATHRKSVAAVSTRAAAELGRLVEPAALAEALETGWDAVQQQLDLLHLRQGENIGRTATLTANRDRLDTAHGDCPVCRRALDAPTVRTAQQAHDADLRRLTAEARNLRRREARLLARQTRLRELRQELRQIPHPGPPPVNAPPPAGTTPSIDELADAVRFSLDALVSARATKDGAAGELEQAVSDERAALELERQFAADAVLRATRDTAASTVRELLQGTIHPLAREIDARWQALFPDRGDVTTHSDGSITRDVNGETLPFSSFSTGERMGTLILLRLLVLVMATQANFCWFDEPLEHLDPDARRQVAALLARAGRSGPLRQILVTTYEEPLARRLEARDPDHVRLVYVRPRVA